MKRDEMRPTCATVVFLGALLAALFLFQPCREPPIVFRFVGSGSDMKVLQASSDCLNPG